MEETARFFKNPTKEEECNSISCRTCITMVDILLFPTYSWECFRMEKAREFRKSNSL
jgi:hypothetical protein